MVVLNVILWINKRWTGTAEETFQGMRYYGNDKMAINKSLNETVRIEMHHTLICSNSHIIPFLFHT